MFLDLVSVGHISMSHAKICPGTPPLVNISFSLPTYWNHPVSSGRHVCWGGMAWCLGIDRAAWSAGHQSRASSCQGPGIRYPGHVTRGSCHYPITNVSLCDETVTLVWLPNILIINHQKTLPLSCLTYLKLLYVSHGQQHRIRQKPCWEDILSVSRGYGGRSGWAGIPVPGHFREYRPPIPVPERREWNFLLPFPFAKIGNGIFIPVPVPGNGF